MRKSVAAALVAASLSGCASRAAAALDLVAAGGFVVVAVRADDCGDDCIVDGQGLAMIGALSFAMIAAVSYIRAENEPPSTKPDKPPLTW